MGFAVVGFLFNNQSSTPQGAEQLQGEETSSFEGVRETLTCSLLFGESCISLNTVVRRTEMNSYPNEERSDKMKVLLSSR